MLRTPLALTSISRGNSNIPAWPVPSTRIPDPSNTTSPVNMYIIRRVPFVSRLNRISNGAACPATSVVVSGFGVTN